MALIDSEASAEDGAPVYLYEFTADDQVYRLTPHAVGWTHEGDFYAPTEGVKHGNLVRTGVSERSPEMTVTVPERLALVQDNCYGSIPTSFALRIHKIQPNGDAVWWDGKVDGGVTRLGDEGNWFDFRCPSAFDDELERDTPWLKFTAQCQHFLFDPYCGLDPLDFANAAAVDTISGVNLIVDDIAGKPDNYYRGGVVLTTTGKRRLIVEQLGTTITLLAPFRDPPPTVGNALTLYPGCDRYVGTCFAKFDNREHFGGFPLVPLRNIFLNGLRGI